MASVWILLSTHWSLSSVRAALNVIISVLCTVGIWSFSRYWWQRGSSKIVREKRAVPLSALFTFTDPGEGWDLIALLRRQVLAKENWHLLAQLIVVASVTLACMLSGPIAKVSLKSGQTVRQKELQVLQTIKGGGYFGNLVYAEVLWNDTIQSLDQARYPTTQLLDYLPPLTEPWVYVADEWNPTWSVLCDNTPETEILNLTGSGNYSIYDPLHAFPAYQDTYNPSWLNTSKYRMNSDFGSWEDWSRSDPIRHVMLFVYIQSDPEVDDRMYTNNETLQISISVLHAQNFQALHSDTGGLSGESWKPIGPVANASYTRTECNITRKPIVADEDAIPWVWTNDTESIASGLHTYWDYGLENAGGRNLPVSTPSAQDLFRFYQAYIVTTNTNHSLPSRRKVSTWLKTVELSVIFLVVFILLSVLTLWMTGRYFIFLRRHRTEIEEMNVPDGKMGWMIHAAKSSVNGHEEEFVVKKRPKDRDHFRAASFGRSSSEWGNSADGPQLPPLARVYNSRSSTSGLSPSSKGRRLSALGEHDDNEDGHERKSQSNSTHSAPSIIVSDNRDSLQISPLDPGTSLSEKMLDPEALKRSLSIRREN